MTIATSLEVAVSYLVNCTVRAPTPTALTKASTSVYTSPERPKKKKKREEKTGV